MRVGGIYSFGDFELRAGSCELLRSGSPTDLHLKPTKLLLYLVENRDRVVSKAELIDEIWSDSHISESTFTTAVGEIRQTLGDDGASQRLIQTRRGRGYQFVAEVLDRDPAPQEHSPDRIARRNRFGFRIARAGVLAVLLAILGLAWWYGKAPNGSVRALAFEERDWVLIAAFDNHSGDALFDGTLEAALARELSNSSFVNVVPRERIQDSLRLMQRPFDTRVDGEVGREICLRDGEIRALLTGRIDKLGSAYVLSTQLVEPRDGVTLVNLSEEATGEDALWPAIRRLSSRVRGSLGEELSQIRLSEQKLAEVTTPSLLALRLFTEADALVARPGESATAELLLRTAVAEDPEFASAYNHLVWAILNQSQDRTDLESRRREALPYAERALELSANATERERYFIRASYFHQIAREWEKAEANYKALLRLDPDHLWANLNMARQYDPDKLIYVVQSARLRPNDVGMNYKAWASLDRAGRWTEALPFARRAAEVALAADEQWDPNVVALMRVLASQDHWLGGDIEALQRELDQWAQTLETATGEYRTRLAFWLAWSYESLGQSHRTEALLEIGGGPSYEGYLASSAARRGELERMRAILHDSALDDRVIVGTAWELAEAGLPTEAHELLARVDVPIGPELVWENTELPFLLGERARLEGRTPEAIWLLAEVVERELRSASQPYRTYFHASASLATALELQGDLEGALDVLERASRERRRTAISGRVPWMLIQLRLAAINRELGHEAKAIHLENEVRSLLAHADPAFWLLQRLPAVRSFAAAR